MNFLDLERERDRDPLFEAVFSLKIYLYEKYRYKLLRVVLFVPLIYDIRVN